MELGTMLVPSPVTRLALILHVGHDLSSHVSLLSGSVDAHELPLAGNVHLLPALQVLPLLGDKVTLTRQVLKGYSSQGKNNCIIMTERVGAPVCILAGFIFGKETFICT